MSDRSVLLSKNERSLGKKMTIDHKTVKV